MTYKPKRLAPTWCVDGGAHHRRINTPGGGLTVGSVCLKCGELREYRAVEPDLPTDFSIQARKHQRMSEL